MYVAVLEFILKNQHYREQTGVVKGAAGDGWVGVWGGQRPTLLSRRDRHGPPYSTGSYSRCLWRTRMEKSIKEGTGARAKRTCLPAQETWETRVPSLGREDPLEEAMAAHSSILAWRIPWTEEPGGLQSQGSQRVRHNWNDLAHTHTCVCVWNWMYTHICITASLCSTAEINTAL